MSADMEHDDTTAHVDEGVSMDPTLVAPDVYAVLHDGERVRILDMKLPAGVTDGLTRPHSDF